MTDQDRLAEILWGLKDDGVLGEMLETIIQSRSIDCPGGGGAIWTSRCVRPMGSAEWQIKSLVWSGWRTGCGGPTSLLSILAGGAVAIACSAA